MSASRLLVVLSGAQRLVKQGYLVCSLQLGLSQVNLSAVYPRVNHFINEPLRDPFIHIGDKAEAA